MKAIIEGIQNIDFTGNDGPVKMVKYHIKYQSKNVEGFETSSVSWNIMTDGKAPALQLGSEVEVEYNKYGKLKIQVA